MDKQGHPTLETLPPECVEIILSCIDLPTLKNLRLTSKSLARKTIGPKFKSFCVTKTIELTRSSLQSFVSLASDPEVGPVVENLRIVAAMYDQARAKAIISTNGVAPRGYNSADDHFTAEDIPNAYPDLLWLMNQQEQQNQNSREDAISSLASGFKLLGKVEKIELDAVIFSGRNKITPNIRRRLNWLAIFIQATKVYCITMSAIAKSGIAVKTLSIYQNTERCSMPLHEIGSHTAMLHTESPGLQEAGRSIQELAISAATFTDTGVTSQEPQSERPYDSFVMEVAPPQRAAPDAKMKAGENTIEFYTEKYDKVFKAVADNVRLPLLESCTIRGLRLSESSLLRFLVNHPHLTNLELRNIWLTYESSWEPIFKHISANMRLKKLHLSDIQSSRGRPSLVPDWEEDPMQVWTQLSNRLPWIQARDFDEESIRRGLKFLDLPLGMLQLPGYVATKQYTQAGQVEFGPPWEPDWFNRD